MSSGRDMDKARETDVWTASVHGLDLSLSSEVRQLRQDLCELFSPFASSRQATGYMTYGALRPYEPSQVLRSLSAAARRVRQAEPWVELYQDGERFWLVDDGWGVAEVNLLRGHWRSWVFDQPSPEPRKRLEGAVIWPMAQLFRQRGVHLQPLASVAGNDLGILLVSGADLNAELATLISAGYRLIGNGWTAIRAEDGQVDLLPVTGEPARNAAHAFGDIVLIIEPGRRSEVRARELAAGEAQEALRHALPLADLLPTRRGGQLPGQLARCSRCIQVQLSRRPADLPLLLDAIRDSMPKPTVTVYISPPVREQMSSAA